jgi:transposase
LNFPLWSVGSSTLRDLTSPAPESPIRESGRLERRRLREVERLPDYAPDLNPIEQLWGNVKTRELANVCAPSLAALRPPLRAGFARVRRQPQLAFAFLRHAGLEF